jgi:hypothetical protein
LSSGPHFIDADGTTIHRHRGNYNEQATFQVAKFQLFHYVGLEYIRQLLI